MAEQKVIADQPAQQAQSESADPKAGLLFVPDLGESGSHAPGQAASIPVVAEIANRRSRNEKPGRKRGVEKMTLEDAFKLEMEVGDPLNDERAVRAASFLLDWASGAGNADVDRVLALNISRVLELAASNMAQTRRRNPESRSFRKAH